MGWSFGSNDPVSNKSPLDVGWILNYTEKATFIWSKPKIVRGLSQNENMSKKAVNYCPAVLNFDAQYIQVDCPFNLEFKLIFDKKKNSYIPVLVDPYQSEINPNIIHQIVFINNIPQFRHKDRPIIQITTPYRFIVDEPAMLQMTHPFEYYQDIPYPGLVICGRFPLMNWPRQLMWAFEFYDINQPLKLNKGQPWFYVRIEGLDPFRPVRLIEATWTDDLKEYCNGLDNVASYTNQTYGLFKTAKERRPKKLLVEKKRDRKTKGEENDS